MGETERKRVKEVKEEKGGRGEEIKDKGGMGRDERITKKGKAVHQCAPRTNTYCKTHQAKTNPADTHAHRLEKTH